MTDEEIHDIAEVQEILARAVNSGDAMKVAEIFCDYLFIEHRTLQQSTIKMLVEILIKYSEASSDLRNEAAVKFCKELKELVDSGKLGAYFPLI